MTTKYIALVLLIILAVASDAKTYKIKNCIHIGFIGTGIALNIYFDGLRGAAASLLGMIVPVLLLIILFALRMLGAGDIKLLSSIGSIMGVWFALETIVYSFLCGGIIALILILLRKNGMERIRHLITYLKSCFLCLSLLPYTDFQDKSDKAKFRFSYAIGCGVVVKGVSSLMNVNL